LAGPPAKHLRPPPTQKKPARALSIVLPHLTLHFSYVTITYIGDSNIGGKHMYSEIVILALLGRQPRHGYEIKKDAEQILGGVISINNKVLYPALKRFEERGAVVRHVVEQEGRPNKHLYQLTERGAELMLNYLRDFSPEQAASSAEFFTRVAFFGLLEPKERQGILQKRLDYVQGRLERLQKIQQMADQAGATGYPQRVLAFHTQQVRNEYQWVATWLEEMRASTK
jgi:DNA-binding PadR family transcriptional regulator